ncbi:MAG: TonB-dependent receptor [Proteobacteria bacterium]|nr:TonB-dependent receptor [Pseudomonadota bacterium]
MLFLFVLVTPSTAAETNPPQSAIDEVVVTAMRDSQDPLKLAGNVMVIEQKSIQALAHTHIADLLVQAPGACVTAGSGQEHLSAIRSPVLTGPGSCGAFLFLEDGVAIRPAGFCNINQLMEINSEQVRAVEVIRGPGSALYGANALHGLLNFLTPADTPSGTLTSFEAGPDNYYRVKFDSGGQSSDWRLLANGTHDGGARLDSGYDQGKLNLFYRHDLDHSHFRATLAATYLNQQTAGFVFGQDAYKDDTLTPVMMQPAPFATTARCACLPTGHGMTANGKNRISGFMPVIPAPGFASTSCQESPTKTTVKTASACYSAAM